MSSTFLRRRSRQICIGMIVTSVILFISVLMSVYPTRVLAQDTREMPLFLIEGSSYIRQTFDKNGNLERSQKMEISGLIRREESLEVQIVLYNDSEDGQTSDTVRTTIECRTSEANMVMNVLALIQPEGKRVAVRVTGGEIRYPFRPTVPDTLAEVELEVRVKQGIVGFLGGKSKMHFRNRFLQPSSPEAREEEATYSITEDLHVKFYALGIKVRSRTYRVEETIQAERGITRHELISKDGSYVLLERLD